MCWENGLINYRGKKKFANKVYFQQILETSFYSKLWDIFYIKSYYWNKKQSMLFCLNKFINLIQYVHLKSSHLRNDKNYTRTFHLYYINHTHRRQFVFGFDSFLYGFEFYTKCRSLLPILLCYQAYIFCLYLVQMPLLKEKIIIIF